MKTHIKVATDKNFKGKTLRVADEVVLRCESMTKTSKKLSFRDVELPIIGDEDTREILRKMAFQLFDMAKTL